MVADIWCAGEPAAVPRDEPSDWDPGRSLGIIGLIFSVTGVAGGIFSLLVAMVIALIGGIVSTVAFVRSRRAGSRNGYALARIIVGFGILVVWLLVLFFAPLPVPPS